MVNWTDVDMIQNSQASEWMWNRRNQKRTNSRRELDQRGQAQQSRMEQKRKKAKLQRMREMSVELEGKDRHETKSF